MTPTGIPYLDAVWNVTRGCSRCGPACQNCYAERLAKRFCGPFMRETGRGVGATGFGYVDRVSVPGPFAGFADERGWTGRVELLEDKLDEPLRSRKPQRVGVCFTSDWMHPALPDSARDQMLVRMALCPHITFITLTKRWKEQYEYFCGEESPYFYACTRVEKLARDMAIQWDMDPVSPMEWPLPNVHLGVTAWDQASLDEAAGYLLRTPAAVRWVSLEPLLDGVVLDADWVYQRCPECGCHLRRGNKSCDFADCDGTLHAPLLDWIVAGCESGPRRRPAQIDWFRDLRDQCVEAGVPYYLKQMEVDGRVVEHPELDGQVWRQLP